MEAGAADAREAGLTARDAVVGVSASGSTAYVLAAIEVARARGALVVGLSCASGSLPIFRKPNLAAGMTSWLARIRSRCFRSPFRRRCSPPLCRG